MKIDTIFHTHMLHWHYSFVYTERGISKINALDLSFLFKFFSRWINTDKSELIHLHKNIKKHRDFKH